MCVNLNAGNTLPKNAGNAAIKNASPAAQAPAAPAQAAAAPTNATSVTAVKPIGSTGAANSGFSNLLPRRVTLGV